MYNGKQTNLQAMPTLARFLSTTNTTAFIAAAAAAATAAVQDADASQRAEWHKLGLSLIAQVGNLAFLSLNKHISVYA